MLIYKLNSQFWYDRDAYITGDVDRDPYKAETVTNISSLSEFFCSDTVVYVLYYTTPVSYTHLDVYKRQG